MSPDIGAVVLRSLTTDTFWIALVIAVLIVVGVTFVQVVTTYPSFEMDVHRLTRATLGLYLLNITLVAFFLLVYWTLDPTATAGAGVVVGFGYPLVAQSRFTLARPLAGGSAAVGVPRGMLSIDIGAYYNVVVDRLRREMDSAVEIRRQEVIAPVVARFSGTNGLTQLHDAALTALQARGLTPEQKAEHEANVATIMASSDSALKKKRQLCRKILFLMGKGYVRHLALPPSTKRGLTRRRRPS